MKGLVNKERSHAVFHIRAKPEFDWIDFYQLIGHLILILPVVVERSELNILNSRIAKWGALAVKTVGFEFPWIRPA